MINLISDTVTKPSKEMLDVMFQAEVGDDVFRKDPTINALEEKVALLFGKEAALFCPSGTMTNQIAINIHTQPLDEVIAHQLSHIHQSEGGSYAFHSGVSVTLLPGERGKITVDQVKAAIKPEYDWTPRSTLVVLENTANIAGGSFYKKEEIKPIADFCRQNGLGIHLDGARIFNALVESGDTPAQIGELFDTISVCLSKGLGAPVGSLLLGSEVMMKKARRIRKIMGGGMRQAGYLAAAGIYALDNNVERLKEDHKKAKELANALKEVPFVENMRDVETNIVIFDVSAPHTAASFLQELEKHNILAVSFGPQTIRFVTHLDYSDAMHAEVLTYFRSLV
ncbi:MAG: aminotransferase class I/II-fold pyridoxal phosphate-dependent enzyme [Saprospiraceae bacterium]|nr:aminotransferase class I/II-fold pyridoxal phosphate-dependent enzyme [Saprospiraceae bacterium]